MTHETTARSDTALVLAQVLADLLGGDPARYHPSTELFGALPELDSLALVELITVLEERFDKSGTLWTPEDLDKQLGSYFADRDPSVGFAATSPSKLGEDLITPATRPPSSPP